tara:strand:+ start:8366 stop:9538 length:1173 start_codon:yes stop_codon:yes gene_type:complete
VATKINIRSPYYVKVSNGSLASATMELFIYTGTFTTDKGTAKYTITKNEIGTNNYVVYEIAELVRDYLDIEFNGEYDSQTVWVEADIEMFSGINGGGSSLGTTSTDYIALDGFGYFEEGINAELSRTYLQSNKEIFRPSDFNTRVPVFTEDTDSVSFLYQGEVKRVQAVTSSTNTNAQIDYITVSGSDNTDAYKERVLADGGVFEDNSLLQAFLNAIDIGLVDELYINSDSGTEVIKIRTEPCSKYEPYKVTFVNKFGALQDMFFSLKSIQSLTTTGETYKANAVDFGTLTYDTYKPQVAQYNKLGKESITLNTDYVSEQYNEVIKQLMMSEQVWLTRLDDPAPDSNNLETVLAVIPKTQSVTYKTSLNDRLVQYTVDFNYAFDKMNTVR